ncbi:hypothetical protein SAMN04487949_1209 [Halogranum gelatinilyticum]|uniref:KaiC protein n=1 Tax=Halogranum gelatinilyticum TaxID=660521 RepID=A0A1G9R6M6_9EURY|nr:hypothetical protein [Halogranum gelatinilyticum]SDM18926.1 hypothetical protein SAMN04487949_1209 [Halogranum gelatinilyticum]
METPVDDLTFSRSLSALKQRGSNLLVVGSAAETVRKAAARRFLGDGVGESRRRLFVFTDAAHTDTTIGSGPVTHGTTRVVTRETPTRGAAGVQQPSAATPTELPSSTQREEIEHRTVDSEQLGTLAWAIEQELSGFERDGGPFATGELRLCFDSLTPLLSTHDTPAVLRFLRAIGNRVRADSGMAHYHLPVARDDPAVDELAPLFDAVIELRLSDGRPEHRWILRDESFESDWLPL